MFSVHPRTIWAFAGLSLTTSFGSDNVSCCLMGSDLPARGLLVTWMANGTACGSCSLFLGASRNPDQIMDE
jgi:hypothetical protein